MDTKFSSRNLGWAVWPAMLMTAVACGDDASDPGVASDTYYKGALSAGLGSANNQADCATCHSDDGTVEGYSGETFMDIAYRSAFKGGDAPNLLAATNACVTGWMGGDALEAQDPAWIALEGFLQSISDPTVTAPNVLMPEVLQDEAAYEAAYGGGDPGSGEAKYATYCGVCHDSGLVVGPAPAWPKAGVSALSVGRIAQKVRTAGPPPSGAGDTTDSTPGPMPFFEAEELSADDLKDIIAYLKG